ncbi:MAG: discoidin domain-containing protein, partial [Kiritimatiellales bacterium]
VRLAWYKGDLRATEFSVEGSVDAEHWGTLLSHRISSGETADFEPVDFSPVCARYLRVVGYGNSDNDWNSLCEIEILGLSSGLSGSPVLSGGLSGNELQLSAAAEYGATYQLQWTGSLTTGSWQNVGSLQVGGGGDLVFSHSLISGTAAGFYRLTVCP